MRWAAPESPITRPTMAPSPMVSMVSPIWSGILSSPMPRQEQGGEAVQSELGHQDEQDQDTDPDHHERHVRFSFERRVRSPFTPLNGVLT